MSWRERAREIRARFPGGQDRSRNDENLDIKALSEQVETEVIEGAKHALRHAGGINPEPLMLATAFMVLDNSDLPASERLQVAVETVMAMRRTAIIAGGDDEFMHVITDYLDERVAEA